MTKAKAPKSVPKDIADIALNPVRVRIIQALVVNDELTAAQIGSAMSDVSRTTLYRHINILIEAGLITVVAEKKIRGSVERSLALNVQELGKQMSPSDPAQEIFKLLMGTYVKFQKYLTHDNADLKKDKFFISNSIMMMSDEEFSQFLKDLQELSEKYYFENEAHAGEVRKPRDLTIISAPPTTFDTVS